MWSVIYRAVNRRQGNTTSRCRVCKQQTTKVYVTEKKIAFVFWLIPIPLKKEYFEICSACKARVRVIINPELIDP